MEKTKCYSTVSTSSMKKKLYPRGKTLTNLMKIQREFIKYRRSEEYLQKLCDDYAAKYGGAAKSQEES
ncbi:hypothetical protein [Morganella morganii]|uniref:hypothetical protein n=1 Tax=Morganella morganii TaxID=582 RepID=UPI0030FEE771